MATAQRIYELRVRVPRWLRRAGWLRRAACAGLDPETFFPTPPAEEEAAKAVCASCPVVEDCRRLVDVLERGRTRILELHGVWAGEAPRDRLRRRHPEAAATAQARDAERKSRWARDNRERVRENHRRWVEANRERVREYERRRPKRSR